MSVLESVATLTLRVTLGTVKRYYIRSQARPSTTLDLTLGEGDRSVPIRVLVAGAGLAEGYGVHTQWTALAGQVGICLAARTGRGVIVSTRTKPALALEDTSAFLGQDALKFQDVVVFAPGFLEISHARSARWHAELFRLVEFMRQHSNAGARIVLTGMPMPRSNRPLSLLARGGIRAANTAMRDVARSSEGTTFVPVPSIASLRIFSSSFNARFYVRCGESIVEVLAPELTRR